MRRVDNRRVLSGITYYVVIHMACAGWMPRLLMDSTKPSTTASADGQTMVSFSWFFSALAEFHHMENRGVNA